MKDLNQRVADLERDIAFIYDFLTDEELRKLPFAERLAEHKEQREPLPKKREHRVPKKGVKLDEFDVLAIRNLHWYWTIYDPVLHMCEASILWGDDGPVLDEDGCAVEDPDYTYPETIGKRCSLGILIQRCADYYSVNHRTIEDIIKGKTWPHVGVHWNPERGGKCYAWSRESAERKLVDWKRENGTSPPCPEIGVTDGEIKVADWYGDGEGLSIAANCGP